VNDFEAIDFTPLFFESAEVTWLPQKAMRTHPRTGREFQQISSGSFSSRAKL
jgi:hypothetical protein